MFSTWSVNHERSHVPSISPLAIFSYNAALASKVCLQYNVHIYHKHKKHLYWDINPQARAHHPERTSTLYPWSNLCPDWAIFRNVFPTNFCLHCGPYTTELNAEKNGSQSKVLHPLSVFLNHFLPFPHWFRPYADRSGDRYSRETILKITQSGHRLSLRLSMGDVRSGWWAPAPKSFKIATL